MTGTSEDDDSAILVAAGSAIVRSNTVTFTGATHYRSGIELTPAGGNAIVDYNYIFNATRGIYVDHRSTGSSYFRYNIFDGCGHGIYFFAGAGETVQNNTIYRGGSCSSGTSGVRLSNQVSQSTISKNLFINVETGINCNSATNMTYAHNIYSEGSCGSGQASNCSLSASEVAEKECLLCEEHEAPVEYFTQRIDSEAASGNNGWGEDVGAKGVQCAWGTLARNTTVSPYTSVYVLEDVTVPTGKKLTLGSGTTFRFDDTDGSSGGIDTGENELVIDDGTLTVNGTGGSPVTLKSSAGSPAAGDWFGVVVKNGGKAFLDHTNIQHSIYGVYGPALCDTVQMDDCALSHFSETGVHLYPNAVAPTAKLYMTGGSIDMSDGYKGVFGRHFGAMEIDGVSITGDATGLYGVYADTVGSSEALVKNCTVDGLEDGTGIYVKEDSPTLQTNTVEGCKWGIRLLGTGSPTVERVDGSSDGTQLNGCTTGMYVSASTATVDSVSVGSPSGGTGLYTDGTSQGTYTKVKITGGSIGIQASSTDSTATFRGGKVVDFTTNGIKYNGPPGMDIGTNANAGNNSIYSSGASGKWINVKTCVTGVNVHAQKNYWNGTPSSSNYSTCVDYANWLTSPPSRPVGIGPTSGVTPVVPSFVARPNPFVDGLRFSFTVVGEGASPVDLDLFDLAGRRIRSFVSEPLDAGEYERQWDGRDSAGNNVAAGIYFVRFHSGATTITHKLVKVQ